MKRIGKEFRFSQNYKVILKKMSEIRESKRNSFPKLLYLDQNQWDKLEKVYYNEREDPLIEEVLSNLQNLVKEGIIRIVIDINRQIETSRRDIEESRKKLADFMLKLSKGYFVLPSFFLEKFEIKNYFHKKLGVQEFDIKELAIGKETEYLVGGMPSIETDKIDKEDLNKLNMSIKEYFSRQEFIEGLFYKFLRKDNYRKKQSVEKAEANRKILYSMENERQRRDYQTEQNWLYLSRMIFEVYELTDNSINDLEKKNNALMIIKYTPLTFNRIKEKRDFIKQFPLIYTHCTLVDFRNRDLRRDILGNDTIDIVSYVLPIVYFDFVVGEKYFINLAKQAKLDKEYGTILLRELSDLKEFLNKLNNNFILKNT